MKAVVIGFALLFGPWVGWPLTVLPLASTPEHPAYLRSVPALLSTAQEEVLVALSDLRSYGDGPTAPLLSPLIAAAQAGVTVWVLVERTPRPPSPDQARALAELRQAGAEVREDNPEIPLNAKFLVIDRRWVVVGSTHWTKTALTGSVQVDLALEEPTLAALFRTFFFHLWEGKVDTRTEIPTGVWPEAALFPLLDFPESRVHFTLLRAALAKAQEEIVLLLTQLRFYPGYAESPSTLLLQDLVEAARRGVRVRVLLAGGENDPFLADTNRLSASWLTAYGVEVRLTGPGTVLGAKCLMVDGRHVLVSSANWNYASLVRNVEAGVLLWGAPELVQPLRAWFVPLWEGSRPLS